MKRIPPHIGWPLLIIGFLLLGVTWSMGVVVASQSDGGPEIVDDYYEKAISWDEEAQRRARSDAQNWDISVSVQQNGEEPVLSVNILDANGNPVEGLTGSVYALRPQKAKPIAKLSITPSHTAGLYTYPFPSVTRGLWDFRIEAEVGTLPVYTTIRKEF